MGVRVITGDFSAEGDVLRHASDRVAETVLRLGLGNYYPDPLRKVNPPLAGRA